jgi:hypothetical protein
MSVDVIATFSPVYRSGRPKRYKLLVRNDDAEAEHDFGSQSFMFIVAMRFI